MKFMTADDKAYWYDSQENAFKIKVPNSVGVCVLDGRNWNYLKRKKNDKNLWFGKVMIYNPNVLILSMKDNSLFTEVFQTYNRRPILFSEPTYRIHPQVFHAIF